MTYKLSFIGAPAARSLKPLRQFNGMILKYCDAHQLGFIVMPTVQGLKLLRQLNRTALKYCDDCLFG